MTMNPSNEPITLMGMSILRPEYVQDYLDLPMFQGHPCAQNPCSNGGRCTPQLDVYACVCLSGFSGANCQHTIFEKSAGEAEAVAFDGRTFIEYHNAKSAGEAEAVAFDGRTFIEYHNAVIRSEKALLVNKFELSIRTEATHGLILWSGKGLERSDYIALAIVDGRVQMTYDLGSKPVVLRSSVFVDTNRWIHIKASSWTPTVPSGGLEELAVARRLPKAYSTGFVGCMKDVLVDGVELHLPFILKSLIKI
ncbi:hypothetical protein CRUP_032386 [Coryphaenoides rupestris]|nr:hypothetical protein CRUP_032386 [Coryphaenoides rupestris]